MHYGQVSIIVPIYNAEAHLERCISSLLAQSYSDTEILLINDGSTDDSLKICNAFATANMHIRVISQDNQGVSSARNRGIESAKGDFLTFIDADDVIAPDAISKMVSELTTSGADAIRTRCLINRAGVIEKEPIITPKLYQTTELNTVIEALVLGRMRAYMGLLMLRADKIPPTLRLDQSLQLMEDTCFYIDLLKSIDSFKISDSITYTYIINDSGATHNSSKFVEYSKNILAINERFNKLLYGENYLPYMNAVHIKMITNFAFIIRTRHRSSIHFKNFLKLFKDNDYSIIIRNSKLKSIPFHNSLLAWAITLGFTPTVITIEILRLIKIMLDRILRRGSTPG